MRVLLINDSTSNPNWGDRAAAYSLMAMIESTGCTIEASISEQELGSSSIGVAWQSAQSGAPRGPTAFVKPLVPPILFKAARSAARRLDLGHLKSDVPTEFSLFAKAASNALRDERRWRSFLNAARSCDVAVIHGDGCMTGNGIVARTELFLAYILKTYFDLPAIIVNHTADFSDPRLRGIAAAVYPLLDDVVFRDPYSVSECASFCSGRFAPDTAFWFEPAPRESWAAVAGRPTYFDVWPDTAAFDPAAAYVCVGGSSIIGGLTDLSAVRSGYAKLLSRLRRAYAGQVVLTASDMLDERLFRPLATEYGLPLVGLTTPIQQAVDILGNADAYIGGRWHSGILAIRGGAPLVPLSAKTLKMQALADMAGMSPAVFEISRLAEESSLIVGQLMERLRDGEKSRNELRRWAAGAADDSWENVAYLRRMMDIGQDESVSHEVDKLGRPRLAAGETAHIGRERVPISNNSIEGGV